jgi:hypothetical protein
MIPTIEKNAFKENNKLRITDDYTTRFGYLVNQQGPLVPAKMEWKNCYGIKEEVGIRRYMSRKIDLKETMAT